MKLLTQNRKMSKSSNDNIVVYNWTIPAYKAADGTITCPNAQKCIKGCYAKQGAYIWTNVSAAHNKKYQLTLQDNFSELISAELTKITKRGKKQVYVRIHDAGDFYSLPYLLKWIDVMLTHPNVEFYAYTKQIELFNWVLDKLPSNFKVIYSYGGKQDHLIDKTKHRHARVFESTVPDNYINASDNDLKALTSNHRVGLVYHGTRSYKNTTWSSVK